MKVHFFFQTNIMAFSYGTWSKQPVFACAVSVTTYYMGLLTKRVKISFLSGWMQGQPYSQWAHSLSLNFLLCWKIGKIFLPGYKFLMPRLSLGWLMCLLYLVLLLHVSCRNQRVLGILNIECCRNAWLSALMPSLSRATSASASYHVLVSQRMSNNK